MFGSEGGTYLVFLPMKSLKSIDVNLMTEPGLLKAMGEEECGRIMKMADGAVAFEETNLYTFNPKV